MWREKRPTVRIVWPFAQRTVSDGEGQEVNDGDCCCWSWINASWLRTVKFDPVSIVNRVGYPSKVPSMKKSREDGCDRVWIELMKREDFTLESISESRHLSPERLLFSFLNCLNRKEFGDTDIVWINVREYDNWNRWYSIETCFVEDSD